MTQIYHEGTYCPACTENSVMPGLPKCNPKREKNIKLAKKVYNDIAAAIEKWESHKGYEVNCNWDGYITIDGEDYSYYELKEDEKKLLLP